MSDELHMVHMRPDLRQLLPWAQRQGLVPEQGQGDLGYAFHAALKAAFGECTPQPFSYRAEQGMLAYSTKVEALRAAAALATPEVACMLGLDASDSSQGLLTRPFPQQWKPGQRLSFEVRVRPVVRKDDKEIDAFLATSRRLPDTPLSREAVYGDWLKRQLVNAAHLQELQMDEFRLGAVVRRTARQAEGGRPIRLVRGPEALFTGVLQVRHADAFAALVARGVGRHRAFGFGMLLLKPAATFWG